MEADDQVYVRLQKHLDKQAVGFPATRSRAEIRILKRLFTPRQAEIASHLSYKLEPVETIYPRVGHLVRSAEELSEILDSAARNGGIFSSVRGGKTQYCNIPYVLGMFESQSGRLTPEFIRDHNAYIGDRKFAISFLATEVPQMRTIPIAKSTPLKSNVATFDEVAVLVQQAAPPFRVFKCICRQKKSLEDEPCKVTNREETCLVFGDMAQWASLSGIGREITKHEVMSILEMNQKEGLVLQPSNTEEAEFICSCCGCCCGMLAVHKFVPKPLHFWASNFQSVVDVNACDGCGACELRCQVAAMKVQADTQLAVVDLNRCIGCGLCVSVCTKQAIFLKKKSIETRPPKTYDDLYDLIMAKKKSRWGRMKLTGGIMVDAILTRQTHLLKSEQTTPKESG